MENQKLLLALEAPTDPYERDPRQHETFNCIAKILQELGISIQIAYEMSQEMPALLRDGKKGIQLMFKKEPGFFQLATFTGESIREGGKFLNRGQKRWICKSATFIT